MGGLHIESIAYESDRVIVSGEDVSISARLAIIAVGANIALLRSIGLLKRNPSMILAARAYFEGLDPADDLLDFYFDDVAGPGYGWIFPLSDGTANVGAGFLIGRRNKLTAREAFDQFAQHNISARRRLCGARQVGLLKSYPLRIDFANAPTYHDGMLLVGEAAGLVNPLTGEGIDFALESGEIAAEFAVDALRRGDVSRRGLSEYDHLLRRKFQSLFVATTWLRRLYIHPMMLRLLIDRANRHPELRELLGGIVTATVDPWRGLNPLTIAKYLLA